MLGFEPTQLPLVFSCDSSEVPGQAERREGRKGGGSVLCPVGYWHAQGHAGGPPGSCSKACFASLGRG